ncbi:MAG: thioether cross-link-forming SCIFF peptide maturase [Oscillospiraceae bacterium]|nr:thioether cross-link-forming SCIFF peptide maturase [Oscillospiraceae bacterium]
MQNAELRTEIMVHQYKLAGRNIVIDTNSGAIHLVDGLAYDAIAGEGLAALQARYPEAAQDEIAAVFADIEALKAAGQLFTPDAPYREIASEVKRSGEVKALCLHVAHTCNLTCEYCFAREGQYHGAAALMPFVVGKQALDFLLAHSGARRYLEVDFFGGEPLLNWDVVKALVAYGRSQEKKWDKVFRFTLTTNGMLIDDEVIDFANREMENVVLSLDGRRAVHDRFRKTASGGGSYDIVVPKMQELVRRRNGRNYYIRGTFTRQNLDFVTDILHMADLGLRELSMEPVVGPPDDPHAIRAEDLPAIFAEYERLAEEMERRRGTEGEFRFYHYILNLDHGPCVYKRLTGCGSGTEYLAVTPEGDLYPCHQFVGDPKYVMGDVRQGVVNTAARGKLAGLSVYTRPDCADCWARLYCGGGCAANAYHVSGDVRGIDGLGCAMFKKRLECAIALRAGECV